MISILWYYMIYYSIVYHILNIIYYYNILKYVILHILYYYYYYYIILSNVYIFFFNEIFFSLHNSGLKDFLCPLPGPYSSGKEFVYALRVHLNSKHEENQDLLRRCCMHGIIKPSWNIIRDMIYEWCLS